MTEHSYNSVSVTDESDRNESYNSAEDATFAYHGNHSALGNDSIRGPGMFKGPSFISTSKKHGTMLVLNGFLFYSKGGNKGTSYWECAQNDCKAKAHTRGTSITKDESHAHDQNYSDVATRVFNHRLKQAVETDKLIPTGQIYSTVASDLRAELILMGFEESFIASVVKYNASKKSMMDRWRRESKPRVPRYLAEIDLHSPSYSQIVDSINGTSQQFVLYEGQNDSENPMIIFATSEFLKILSYNNGGPSKVFSDGTFKACPSLFNQLYTIHSYYREHLFPCVFILCTDRTQATYKKLLDIVDEKILSLTGQRWVPSSYQTDFELPMIRALEAKWPQLDMKGCFFHFAKAVFSKAHELGLKELLGEVTHPIRHLVRGSASLPFLPANEVPSTFDHLTQLIESDLEYTAAAKRFIKYMRATWVGFYSNRQRHLQIQRPRFKQSMWTQYRVFSDRTSNKVEGWHSKLNKLMPRSKSVYDFITVIIKMQRTNDTQLATLREMYKDPPKTKNRYKIINEQIKQYTNEFDSNQYDADQFLRKIAFALPSF